MTEKRHEVPCPICRQPTTVVESDSFTEVICKGEHCMYAYGKSYGSEREFIGGIMFMSFPGDRFTKEESIELGAIRQKAIEFQRKRQDELK